VEYDSSIACLVAAMKCLEADFSSFADVSNYLRPSLKNGKKYLPSFKDKLNAIMEKKGFIENVGNLSYVAIENLAKEKVVRKKILDLSTAKSNSAFEQKCECCGKSVEVERHDKCGANVCTRCASSHRIECTTPVKKKKNQKMKQLFP